MTSLPGNDLIVPGIEDLRHQRQTAAALLVAIGAPKLRSLGVDVPDSLPTIPEHRLYDLLSATEPDSRTRSTTLCFDGWSASSEQWHA
jgi:hypothetical protein